MDDEWSGPIYRDYGRRARRYVPRAGHYADGISVKMQTNIGSSGAVAPIYLSYRLMLLQRGGVQLNEWARSYFLGGYYGEWVNQQQYHITYPGISRIVTAVSPFLRLWMVRTDGQAVVATDRDRKSTRLNSSHHSISYAVFCLKK